MLEEDRAQLAAVRGEFYEIDGTVFDLGRTFVDVTGGRWQWTGCRDDRSVPLMDFLKHPGDHRDMTVAEREPVPLDEVQRWFGPLIPEPARLTAADYQRALLAPTPRDVFGGAA
nr:phiSA1p31-related protein [Streptomyces olivoverticillatus]